MLRGAVAGLVCRLLDGALFRAAEPQVHRDGAHEEGDQRHRAHACRRGRRDWRFYAEDITPGVLHAYDARNLGRELIKSTLGDVAVKFTIPTVANGRVYVATQGQLVALGLLQ